MNPSARIAAATRVVIPPPDVSAWDAVLRECEAHVDRAGWDQPTALFWVDWHDGDHGGMSGLGVLRATLPPALGGIVPTLLLNALADLWHAGRPAAVPANFVAVVVVFEGWAARGDPDEAAAWAALRADQQAGRIHQRPDAREARIALMTLLQQSAPVVMMTRIRGQQPGPVVAHPTVGGVPVAAAALRRLAAAVATRR